MFEPVGVLVDENDRRQRISLAEDEDPLPEDPTLE